MKSLLEFYQEAYKYAEAHDFNQTIQWQRNVNFEHIDAKGFFFEYVWVVLASGFKVERARPFFDAFYKSGKGIPEKCDVSKVYKNSRKQEAIQNMIPIYHQVFDVLKSKEGLTKLEYLETLPFIGPVTKFHISKNLGISDFAKPDIHLNRLCKIFKFESAQSLCEYISKETGEKVSVVDLILWFYCSENLGYKELKQHGEQMELVQ